MKEIKEDAMKKGLVIGASKSPESKGALAWLRIFSFFFLNFIL